MNRREFISGMAGVGFVGGCGTLIGSDDYSVSVLGDTHYDTAPDTVYHTAFRKLYDGTGKHPARYQEFVRNAKMWADASRRILAASGRCVTSDTRFVLQAGDLIQGDCCDFAVHRRMLLDTLAFMKGVYPAGLPFLTVCGNHDIRHGTDTDGNAAAIPYRETMIPFNRAEVGAMACEPIDDTTYGFRCGPDLYVMIDFNRGTKTIPIVRRLLDGNRDVRYTFVVSHGGMFPFDYWTRWFYLGDPSVDRERREMRALLASRNAIVLCGHTHHLSLREAKFPEGLITEMTMNTVWGRTPCVNDGMSSDNPAEPECVRDGVATYGADEKWLDAQKGRRELLAEYKPYMTRHWHADAVGHARMRVSDEGVWFDYYGRDAIVPTKCIRLRSAL